jgi:UDP-2-acetamido-2-deoxy-ribo-hexuluronate aminotransferase
MQFIDLKQQYERYKPEILAELNAVLDSGRYILGPAVTELENELSAYTGVKHAIACSSGTDAIMLALMALELSPGDEVIIPDFTFFATAEIVSLLGGRPVFVDIRPDTFNLDSTRVDKAVGPRTRGIMAVSLYGQCADFGELADIARRKNLFLIEDGAQSFGATQDGRKSCSLTEVATTSFYPAKPLGAYGDGGAVFTTDDALAQRIRSLLNHGQVASYRHRYVGINGRLDSLQAAVLKVKLRHFDEELARRQQAAAWYDEELAGVVTTPTILPGNTCSWAQYTVRHPGRERILEHLKNRGIPTAVHYPLPVHRQEAYADLGHADGELENATVASREVFSLPMHPFLTHDEVRSVTAAIREVIE